VKIFFTTYCLFYLLINCAVGQTTPDIAPAYNKTSWENLNAKYNNPKIVIDDKFIPDSIVKRTLDNLDPFAVTKITVLHSSSPKQRNVVYLTTDNLRIEAYQKKLSSFSKEYESCLASRQNKDVHFIYYVDSQILQGSRTDITEILYDIPKDKIAAVAFKTLHFGEKDVPLVTVYTK